MEGGGAGGVGGVVVVVERRGHTSDLHRPPCRAARSQSCAALGGTTGRSTMHGATSGGIGPKPNFPQKGGGCDQGIRLGAGGQPCMWWSQGCSIGCDVCATAAGGAYGCSQSAVQFRAALTRVDFLFFSPVFFLDDDISFYVVCVLNTRSSPCLACGHWPRTHRSTGTTPITGNAPHADKAGFRKRYCNSTMKATLPKHAWPVPNKHP